MFRSTNLEKKKHVEAPKWGPKNVSKRQNGNKKKAPNWESNDTGELSLFALQGKMSLPFLP